MATTQEILIGVKMYALDHYEEGWDVVAECYEDCDIIEEFGKCRTVAGAIRKIGVGVRAHKAYGDDIRGA